MTIEQIWDYLFFVCFQQRNKVDHHKKQSSVDQTAQCENASLRDFIFYIFFMKLLFCALFYEPLWINLFCLCSLIRQFLSTSHKINTQSLSWNHSSPHHPHTLRKVLNLWQNLAVVCCCTVSAQVCVHIWPPQTGLSSFKRLVIRTHWTLIASHYHVKVSGGGNQRR